VHDNQNKFIITKEIMYEFLTAC